MDGLKRPMFTYSTTCIHFKTLFIKHTIISMITGGIMAGIFGPISKTSITTHLEITCYADWICPALLVLLMELVIELYQYRGLNCVRHKGSMVLVP